MVEGSAVKIKREDGGAQQQDSSKSDDSEPSADPFRIPQLSSCIWRAGFDVKAAPIPKDQLVPIDNFKYTFAGAITDALRDCRERYDMDCRSILIAPNSKIYISSQPLSTLITHEPYTGYLLGFSRDCGFKIGTHGCIEQPFQDPGTVCPRKDRFIHQTKEWKAGAGYELIGLDELRSPGNGKGAGNGKGSGNGKGGEKGGGKGGGKSKRSLSFGTRNDQTKRGILLDNPTKLNRRGDSATSPSPSERSLDEDYDLIKTLPGYNSDFPVPAPGDHCYPKIGFLKRQRQSDRKPTTQKNFQSAYIGDLIDAQYTCFRGLGSDCKSAWCYLLLNSCGCFTSSTNIINLIDPDPNGDIVAVPADCPQYIDDPKIKDGGVCLEVPSLHSLKKQCHRDPHSQCHVV